MPEPQSGALTTSPHPPYEKSHVPGGIRTPDPRIRSPMLYPTELLAHIQAGDGNRTHIAGLEGQNSTIELHPRILPKNKKRWSGWRDSNPRPHGPKPRTLPNCATPRRPTSFCGSLSRTSTASATNVILTDFQSFGKPFLIYFFTFFPERGSSSNSKRPQVGISSRKWGLEALPGLISVTSPSS